MKKIAGILIVALIAFGAQLFSQPNDEKPFQKILGKLNLTVEQRKEVNKISVEMAKQVVAQKAKIATTRIDLRQLFKADTPDKSAIEKKMNEMAELGVELQMIKVNSWFSINKLLTPEQQKTWKKALEYGSEMHQDKMMKQGRKHPSPSRLDETKQK